MDINDIGNVLETDLLVIGGGLGGLFTAIKAKQNGIKKVLIVDKGGVSLSGQFTFAGGWIIYLLPEDDLQEWLKAFFLGQQGLCNQDMLESFLVQSTERLRDMEGMGLVHKRVPRGNSYLRMPSRGLHPVKMVYPPTYKDLEGGPAVMSALRDEALRRGVEFCNKMFISEVIVQDNRIQGAVGCHRRTGDFYVFKSRAVVMAASDCSFRGNYACVEQTTGDAFAMAYHAGADLTNMEFFVFNTGPLNFNFRGTGPVASMGATLLNARDEDFMPKYHPEGSKAELNYIVQAMGQEVREGHGPPFYYDFRPTPPTMEESLFLSQGGWMARSLIRLKEKKTHIFDKKVEWIPVPMTLRGGLVTDIDCMSNVQGLFAAGTAHSTGRGVFTGWSGGKCLWTGSTASTFAAKYIECSESERLDLDSIVHLKNRLYSREIHPDTGAKTVNEITRMLQRIIFSFETSILKSEDRLKRALKEVDSIKENELPKAKIPNLHEFIKFKELENMFVTADLYLRASLLRKESRGDHKREDYPDPDNKAWLKWIVLNKDLKEDHRLQKMPWEKYRYQPVDLDG